MVTCHSSIYIPISFSCVYSHAYFYPLIIIVHGKFDKYFILKKEHQKNFLEVLSLTCGIDCRLQN